MAIAIGIDLGATHLRAIRLSGGRVKWIGRWPTPVDPHGLDEILANIARVVEHTPAVVGVATAPALDQNGSVLRWPNRPLYEEFPLRSRITVTLGTPLRMLDDCAAAAVGEHVAASFFSSPATSTLYIGVGTGVGAGLVVADRLVDDVSQSLGLGHTRVPSAGVAKCRCGATGCVQAVASGGALEAAAAAQRIQPNLIASLASRNHRGAARILGSCIDPLAEMILIAVRQFSPDRLVVGGGLTSGGWLLSRLAHRLTRTGVLSPEPARLGDAAAAIGAAILALVEGEAAGLFRPSCFDGAAALPHLET